MCLETTNSQMNVWDEEDVSFPQKRTKLHFGVWGAQTYILQQKHTNVFSGGVVAHTCVIVIKSQKRVARSDTNMLFDTIALFSVQCDKETHFVSKNKQTHVCCWE